MRDLIERLRSVKWEVTDDCGRMPDDPTHECVFVDMRPADFRELLREAADALEAAREDARVLRRGNERLAEALRELVDLKDNVKHSFPNDYAVRKPLAWDKARALLRELEEGKCWT